MGKLRLAFVVAACCGFGQPAFAQATKSLRPALDLDAGADAESGPDPLTPAPPNATPLLAPGSDTTLAESAPATDADPIVRTVRDRLAGSTASRSNGGEADQAALKAFYAQRTAPLWLANDALTTRAQDAIQEIAQADTWGLQAAAFDLPKPAAAMADVEARANAELKLSLAV